MTNNDVELHSFTEPYGKIYDIEYLGMHMEVGKVSVEVDGTEKYLGWDCYVGKTKKLFHGIGEIYRSKARAVNAGREFIKAGLYDRKMEDLDKEHARFCLNNSLESTK